VTAPVTADDVTVAVLDCQASTDDHTDPATVAASRLITAVRLADAAPGLGFETEVQLYGAALTALTRSNRR